MKSKSRQQQIEELEEIDETDVDVEAVGPAISSGKKGKIAVIVISSIFITLVIYLFFFSTKEEVVKLEPVQPVGQKITEKEEVEPVFNLDESYNLLGDAQSANIEAMPIPQVPKLPEIPKDIIAKDSEIANIINQAEQEKIDQEGQQALDDQKNLQPPNIADLPNVNNQFPFNDKVATPDSSAESNNLLANLAKPAANLDPRYAPIVVFSGSAQGVPSRGVGYEKNIIVLSDNSIATLEESDTDIEAKIISDRSTTIAQGKLITAVLETAINTELPGFVRGIVSRDVYGESGNDVLIPRGSRLFGSYSSQVQRGQARVDISWSRLIRPDGVDLGISFNASDQFGRAGINGEVDNKYSSIVTNSILTSILTVGGVALAEQLLDNGSSTTTTNPTTGSTTSTGSASTQAIYDVSKNIVDTVGTIMQNQINTNPVITVPQGTKITVVVNSDIKVPKMSN